jgi:hypothetical protein
MALNANHSFEELNGVKCAIVEKNCNTSRVDFIKPLLEFNGYTVVVAAVAPKAAPKAAEGAESTETKPTTPELFTVGVTDVTFSVMNAIFNRELKTHDKSIVTASYWRQQSEKAGKDEWYWLKSKK